MRTSSNGIAFIKGHERFTAVPYWDFKQWSWGYGTKAPGPDERITEQQAVQELQAHLRGVEQSIQTYVLNRGVSLSQNQFDALVSLVYNLGPGAIFTNRYPNGYQMGSTLYNKILQSDFKGAAARFGDFVKAGGQVLSGLVTRRNQEAALFSTTDKMTVGLVMFNLTIAGFLAYQLFKK